MVDMPQEWTAYPPDSDSGNWEIEDEYGHTATVYGEGETAKSIAMLIAAAPELLAVCRKLFAWQCDDDPYACDDWMEFATELGAMAGRAVADAEGRT